ncbi:conserved hypothetical protein [Ahrensia sp. R2A130]|nr:conserved hypothetical protein [Ahrensia sp. R2A130]
MIRKTKCEKRLTGREVIAWGSYVWVVGSVLFLGTTFAAHKVGSLAKVLIA